MKTIYHIAWAALLLTGCVVSKESNELRERIINDGITDLRRSQAEFVQFVHQSLEAEKARAVQDVDAATAETLAELNETEQLTPETAKMASDAYFNRRLEIEAELAEKAAGLANIGAKIDSGVYALEGVGQIDRHRADLEREVRSFGFAKATETLAGIEGTDYANENYLQMLRTFLGAIQDTPEGLSNGQ